MMKHCTVMCPSSNLTIDEAAIKLFHDLREWGEQEGYDISTLELWDSAQVQQAIASGLSYGEKHVYQIYWKKGPYKWAIFLLHGKSFETCQNGWFFEPANDFILGFAQI